MAKVFLSHSSVDKELVEDVAVALGKDDCIYDKFSFDAGTQTLEQIISSLDKTDIFVLFISEESLESSWVKKEIRNAKKNLDSGIIQRIFPLIVDDSIQYNDDRIPNWLKKSYNIQPMQSTTLIVKKIKQFQREVVFKKHKHVQELENLFVGRNELIQEFETKTINIEGIYPTCIVGYNMFEGMGRRTFLKNALRKTRLVEKLYDPILIPIDSKESIEDFIYKLNLEHPNKKATNWDFTELDLESKIEIAKVLTLTFTYNKEIIFILDEGSIILPNNKIVDWFQKLISAPEFKNHVAFCLISKFSPLAYDLLKLGNIHSYRVTELSVPDTTVLFIKYLQILDINISVEDKKFFLQHMTGIPGQVLFTANLIASSSVLQAKSQVTDILNYSDFIAITILDFIKDDLLAKQILIFMSKIEIISYSILYKVFGDTSEVNNSLNKLFNLSVYNYMFSGFEYFKLNSAIADFISRSKLELNPKYRQRLNEMTKESLKTDLEEEVHQDYSDFLFTLKNMIKNGINIPKRFFYPSLILKSIIAEYYSRKYNNVHKLCKKLLENTSKFDVAIIRETRYWLCLSLARIGDEEFFDEVRHFNEYQGKNKDYNFLMGFYFRNNNGPERAEEYYNKVLKVDPDHSKTKRELVNVYLSSGQYQKALGLSKENYQRYKTNVFHIHAYFSCLVRKWNLKEEEIEILNYLMSSVKKNLHKKSIDILETMKGDYEFYIDNNLEKAIGTLEIALKTSSNKYYAYKSLKEVYQKRDMKEALVKLNAKYSNELRNDDDF